MASLPDSDRIRYSFSFEKPDTVFFSGGVGWLWGCTWRGDERRQVEGSHSQSQSQSPADAEENACRRYPPKLLFFRASMVLVATVGGQYSKKKLWVAGWEP